jgi:tripartite motif-containing protein 2/3
LVPATVVEVNRDDAEDALPPSGDDPSPEELDEAVEEDEADLPTLGRPNSPFPPSHKGRPEPIIVEVVIEPKPEDSLRLPLEILSLLASQEELLVQLSGSTGGSPAMTVKCWNCCNNFDRPKVLHGCFHTFCEPCLEKIQDHPEKITCPQCNTESILGNAGISGLLSDFGIFGMMESSTVNGEHHIQSNICTCCKNRDSTAVARCLTCSNFLCPNCVTAHQFMRCFDGHHVTTLGEITNKDGCPQEIQQLNSICHIMQEGRSKASDLKSNLKNLEAASINLSQHFSKSRSDVNEAFQYYVSLLEERKNDVLRELEGQYSRKQVALSLYSQKAHETIDRIYQVTSFIDRQMRHSSNSEVLMFKHPLEQQFSTLSNNMNAIENIGSLSSDDVCDFEFISNYQAIQMEVKHRLNLVIQYFQWRSYC